MTSAEKANLIEKTPEGFWVIKGETHLNRWVREERRLDHDQGLPEIVRSIKVGSLVIDVGASIGDHTIAYLREVGPSGCVAAFEPHPIAFECLRRNCPGSINFPSALGKEPGTSKLIDIADNVGMSHIGEDGTIDISVTTIDQEMPDLIDKPKNAILSFLKIDAEGSEPDILAGSYATIAKHRPVMMIEVNTYCLGKLGHSAQEIKDFLELLNY